MDLQALKLMKFYARFTLTSLFLSVNLLLQNNKHDTILHKWDILSAFSNLKGFIFVSICYKILLSVNLESGVISVSVASCEEIPKC